MLDVLNRKIDYLRISVTDRCNFRCAYCMPPDGIHQLAHEDMLSYEEILRIVAILSKECGIRKVRITGGEPLVRKDLMTLIQGIKHLGTIQDISMTTNGSLLAGQAQELKAAGLDRVNISLDTFDSTRFSLITRGGKLSETLKGIDSALAAGLLPVKINAVLTEALTEKDLNQFAAMVYEQPLIVRFIEYMPIGYQGIKPGMTPDQVKRCLSTLGRGLLHPVQNKVKGWGPARYFTLPGAKGSFGFITPVSDHFCQTCNRIRLTADGRLKPCLLSNQEINVKEVLKAGSDETIKQLFGEALRQKPLHHHLGQDDESSFRRHMSQIGG